MKPSYRSLGRSLSLVVLLLVATAYFLWTGRNDNLGDFAPVYGSVRCVIAGADPYSIHAVSQQIAAHGGPLFQQGYWAEHSLPYPPLTYYVLAPLGWLSYGTAGLVWFWICACIMWAGFLSVALLAPPRARTFTAVGVAAILATSGGLLRLGQPSALSLGLIAGGAMVFLSRDTRGIRTVATLLFLLASAVKPQLALPVLFAFLLPRHTRRYAFAALAAFFVAFAVSGLVLSHQPSSIHWIAELSQMVHTATPAGMQGRVDTGLIDLRDITSLAIASPLAFTVVDITILAVLSAMVGVGYFRAGGDTRSWVLLAGVAYLTLMLTYHRSYDMRLQVLALPALALLWRVRPRLAAWLTFLSALLLFSTAEHMLRFVQAHEGIAFSHTPLVRIFVERQQAVVVLAAGVSWAIVGFTRASSRRSSGAQAGYQGTGTRL